MIQLMKTIEQKSQINTYLVPEDNKKPTIKDTNPEMEGILDSIIVTYINQKGLLVITTGKTGSGKSYANLRIAEGFRSKLGFKEIYKGIWIIRKKSELTYAFLNAEEGDCLIIEEGSFLLNSKRAMSSDNVELGQNIDVIRKKRLVLFVNLPIQKSLDSHWRDSGSFLIEMNHLYKKEGYSTAKCFNLEYSKFLQKTIQTYISTQRKTLSGKIVNRKVKTTWFGKPLNEQLIIDYEKNKDEHIKMILERNYAKQKQREDKENEKLFGVELKDNSKNLALELRNNKIIRMRNEGLTFKEIGNAFGLSITTVYNIINEQAVKKGGGL